MKKNPNNRFPNHFKEFIEAINKYQVEYLLIGGYAMGVYGHYRGTGDLDIFINATHENAEKLVLACIDYGIPSESLKEEMFLVPKMIGIGNPPLRIEILKKLDTIDFTYAYQRSQSTKVDGVSIKTVSLDDLILLKKAAKDGRAQARDSDDLSFLEKLKSKLKKRK